MYYIWIMNRHKTKKIKDIKNNRYTKYVKIKIDYKAGYML